VADLLVGVVSEPMELYYPQIDLAYIWQRLIILTLYNMFQVASLINLSLIALERLHATLCPFKHCLIDKGFYFKIIFCSWLLSVLMSPVLSASILYKSLGNAHIYLWASHIILTLLTLIISYVIIIVNVKSNPPPQPSSSLASDRKLTVTLFMGTVVSTLAILPWAILFVILIKEWDRLWSTSTLFHISNAAYVLYYASSLVNPLIYAIRMKEFRKAAKDLFCNRDPESSRGQPIEPIEFQAM